MSVTQGKYKNLYAFAVLRADGSVITWGHSGYGGDSSGVTSQLSGVKGIYSNYGAFVALKTDGSVVTWGSSVYGGTSSKAYYNGSYSYTSIADKLTSGVKNVYANSGAFVAVKTDGSVVTWGDAKSGGDASIVTYANGFTYSSVADQLVSVASVTASDTAFAALKKNGTVVTWGDALAGGNSSSVVSSLVKVKQIIATKQDFAALKADGTVVTWGGSAGGDSSSVKAQLTNIKQVFANDAAFVAVKKNGSAVVWGDNQSGGNASAVQSKLTNVKEVVASGSAFAVLKTDGSVVVWGNSKTGGDASLVASTLNNVSKVYANQHAFAALKADGTVVTWGNTFYGGDSSSVVSKLIGVKAIYATDTAFAALKYDGSVVTWGNIAGGGDSSSVASQLKDVIEIYATGNDSSSAFAALKADGSVVTWGDAYYGGNSSSVASSLNGAIDVVKFNDQIGSIGASAVYAKVLAVFDADETLGLYVTTEGKYILSAKGLTVGAMPLLDISLKDIKGLKIWQPAVGEFVVAIDEHGATTDVITSKVGTTGTIYSQWTFDNNTGNATATKAVLLSLADVLAKESLINQDITADGHVGNVITSVSVASGNFGLYQMATGAYILAETGLEVGDIPSSMVTLKASKTANWSLLANTSMVAMDDVANGVELVLATASKTKTLYAKYFFDQTIGVMGKKVIPDAMQLSTYEEGLSSDLNGDGMIASLRVQMGNSVYDLMLGSADWVTAKKNAEKMTYFDVDSNTTVKGALLSINSQAEQDNIMEFLQPFLSKLTTTAKDGADAPYIWTSGSDAVKESTWLWSDKSAIELTDSHWADKPEVYATNKQDYLGVAVSNSADGTILAGQWNDLLGTNKLAYIIEYTLA